MPAAGIIEALPFAPGCCFAPLTLEHTAASGAIPRDEMSPMVGVDACAQRHTGRAHTHARGASGRGRESRTRARGAWVWCADERGSMAAEDGHCESAHNTVARRWPAVEAPLPNQSPCSRLATKHSSAARPAQGAKPPRRQGRPPMRCRHGSSHLATATATPLHRLLEGASGTRVVPRAVHSDIRRRAPPSCSRSGAAQRARRDRRRFASLSTEKWLVPLPIQSSYNKHCALSFDEKSGPR